MALFKVLRGAASVINKDNPNKPPFIDGYAYFTPDDGRFYIDVQLDSTPGYYYDHGVVNGKNIYRIEIESATMAALNNTKLDRGEAIGPLVMNAGTASFVFDGTTTVSIDMQAD